MSSDMIDTLIITVVGITVVFLVLIALSYCFAAMGLIARGKKEKADDDVPSLATTGSDGDGMSGVPVDEGTEQQDEDELAVVIAAAIAAFMDGATSVTSIRRIEDTSAWSRTGRHDQMVSELV